MVGGDGVVTHALVLDGRHLTVAGRLGAAPQALVLVPDSGSRSVVPVTDTWAEHGAFAFGATVDLAPLVSSAPRSIRVSALCDGVEVALRPDTGFDTTPNDELMDSNPVDPSIGLTLRPATAPDGTLQIAVSPVAQSWGVVRAGVVDDQLVIDGVSHARATQTIGALWLQNGDGAHRVDSALTVDGARWRATTAVRTIVDRSGDNDDRRVVWTVVAAAATGDAGKPLRPLRPAVKCLSDAHVKPRWVIDDGGQRVRLVVRYTARGTLAVAVQHLATETGE